MSSCERLHKSNMVIKHEFTQIPIPDTLITIYYTRCILIRESTGSKQIVMQNQTSEVSLSLTYSRKHPKEKKQAA